MDDNNGEDNAVVSAHEQGMLTLKEGRPNGVVLPLHLDVKTGQCGLSFPHGVISPNKQGQNL